MNKSNITFIYQEKYPWDVRIEKFLNAFDKYGISTQLVCRNRSNQETNEKANKSTTILRLPYVNTLPRLSEAMNFPAFFSPWWIFKTYHAAKQNRSKLIIVRDLPLAPLALFVGKLLRVPTAIDLAENYPAMIADSWKYRGPSFVDLFIRNPFLLKRLEKAVLPCFDTIFVVSEFSKARIKALGVEDRKIVVVGNTPIAKSEIGEDDDCQFMRNIKEVSDFIILYVGGLEETRGLDIVIKAIPKLKNHYNRIKFVIVGEGTSKTNLIALSQKLKIEDNVYFAGWRNHKSIGSIINSADVCIIPHYVTEHTDTTIPNKLFDYMLQKKPVITTNALSLRTLVQECKCGYIYVHDNPESLVNAVMKLSDTQERLRCGNAGYDKILNKYIWMHDEARLMRSITQTLGLQIA